MKISKELLTRKFLSGQKICCGELEVDPEIASDFDCLLPFSLLLVDCLLPDIGKQRISHQYSLRIEKQSLCHLVCDKYELQENQALLDLLKALSQNLNLVFVEKRKGYFDFEPVVDSIRHHVNGLTDSSQVIPGKLISAVFGKDLPHLRRQVFNTYCNDQFSSITFDIKDGFEDQPADSEEKQQKQTIQSLEPNIMDDVVSVIASKQKLWLKEEISIIFAGDCLARGSASSIIELIEKPKALDNSAGLEFVFTAMLSSRDLMNALGTFFGKPAHSVVFPQKIYSLRVQLDQVVSRRTIDTGSSSSAPWYQIAKRLYRKLSFGDISDALINASLTSTKAEWAESIVSSLMELENPLVLQLRNLNLEEAKVIPFLASSEKLRCHLESQVFGQDKAIEQVVRGYIGSFVGQNSGCRQIYTFVGASGSGKTLLARELANGLRETERTGYEIVQFSMEGLSDSRDVGRLFGSGSQYTDAGLGELTTAVRNMPRKIILMDEIEKASPEVIRSLLGVLDEGRAKDATSMEEVDFSQAIFIFTSNIGQEVLTQTNNKSRLTAFDVLRNTSATSRHTLPIEFVNRLARGVAALFFPVGINGLKEILQKEIQVRSKHQHEPDFNFPDDFWFFLLSANIPEIGPRKLISAVREFRAEIFMGIAAESPNSIKNIQVNIDFQHIINKYFEFLGYAENNDYQNNGKSNYLYDETNDLGAIIEVCIKRNQRLDYTTKIGIDGETVSVELHELNYEQVIDFGDVRDTNFFEKSLPNTSFDDVFGLKRAIKKLRRAVGWLRDPSGLKEYGVRPPPGYLLAGPPGTGKTVLARAVAGECGVPFFSVSAADLSAQTIGGNSEKVRKLFEVARRYAPSVVFIDEIDAIAAKRGGASSASDRDANLTVNTLLTEIQGFEQHEFPVLFLAATNHPKLLDPALLRPGRIDEVLPCDLPGLDDRAAYLGVVSKKHELSLGPNQIKNLASSCQGFSFAQIDQVVRESVYLALTDDKPCDYDLLTSVVSEVRYGSPTGVNYLNEDEKLRVAYHETGHLIATTLLFPESKLDYITIEPRNQSLGFVALRSSEKIEGLSKKKLFQRLIVLLSGRAAERLCFGDCGMSSGATDDISKATKLALHAIYEAGLDDDIGPVNLELLTKFEESELLSLAQGKVTEWLLLAEQQATSLLEQNRGFLDAFAKQLSIKESLNGDEAKVLLSNFFKQTGLESTPA